MALPLQHPIVRPNPGGRSPPRPTPAGASGSRRCGTCPLLRMVWDTEPRYVVGILLLRVARSLVPLAVLWIGKLIVDEVVHAVAVAGAGGAGGLDPPGELLAHRAGHRAGGRGAEPGLRAAREPAGRPVRQPDQRPARCSTRPRSTWSSSRTPRSTTSWSGPGGRRWGGSASSPCCWRRSRTSSPWSRSAAALAVYVPWLLVLLVVAVLPSLLGETHFASLGYSLLYSWTPERRQLDYLRYIGASDISAKELKLFGLSDFLVGRYDRLSQRVLRGQQARSPSGGAWSRPCSRWWGRWATTAPTPSSSISRSSVTGRRPACSPSACSRSWRARSARAAT